MKTEAFSQNIGRVFRSQRQ